jgi:small subunit ribosomal protein S27Ae
MAKKEKKARKKGKRIRKGRKHESVKIWKKYEVKGESLERNRGFCPRCGEGVWLSKQKNRLYCGKCGYTSFKQSQPQGQEKSQGTQEKEGNPAEEEKKD